MLYKVQEVLKHLKFPISIEIKSDIEQNNKRIQKYLPIGSFIIYYLGVNVVKCIIMQKKILYLVFIAIYKVLGLQSVYNYSLSSLCFFLYIYMTEKSYRGYNSQ